MPKARSFRGQRTRPTVERASSEIETGSVRRVVFAVPTGAVWSLPAYELALMTAAWIAEREISDVELLSSPESEPLHVFGTRRATRSLGCSLGARSAMHLGAYAAEARAVS